MISKLIETYKVKDQCSTTLRGKLKEYKEQYKNKGLDVDTQHLWMRSNLENKQPNAVKIFMETEEDVVFLKAQKSNELGRLPGASVKEIRTLDDVEKNVLSLLDECTEFLKENMEEK